MGNLEIGNSVATGNRSGLSKASDSLVRMAAAQWLHDAAKGTVHAIPLENLLKEMQSAECAELPLMALAALPEDIGLDAVCADMSLQIP